MMSEIMIKEFIVLSCLSLFFGVTQKIADGHHEHGLNFFPGAGMLFGIISGIIGAYLVTYSSVLQAAYLGPLLYWFYRRKIDCIQHLAAAVIMLIAVAISYGRFTFPIFGITGIFAGYVFADYIKHRPYMQNFQMIFTYRPHFHLV